MDQEVSLIGWRNTGMGFLAGSLIAGGIVGMYEGLVRLVLVLFGIVIIIDSVMSYRDQTHNASSLFTAVIGFIVGLIIAVSGTAFHAYLIIIVILAILSYTHKLIRKGIRRQGKANTPHSPEAIHL